MPLTPDSVTRASRTMLPTYPAFFAIIGLGLALTPERRLIQTPAFRYADQLVDITWWGAGFLVLAVAFIAALIAHRRRAFQLALGVGVVWMSLWAVVTAFAALQDVASFSAWAWSAFVARACWASLVSLESRET